MDDNLVPPFGTPVPVFRVHRWLGRDKRHTYIFVGEKSRVPGDILAHMERAEKDPTQWHTELQGFGCGDRPPNPVSFLFGTVWPDDRVIYGLTKVLKHMHKSDILPFAWNQNGLLRFDWPTLEIDPAAVDPWEHPLQVVSRQPHYTPHQLMGNDDLNVIFYEDVKGLPEERLHMYFPDIKERTRLLPQKMIDTTESYLSRIWTVQVPTIREISTKIRGIAYRASFDTSRFQTSLSDIFEGQQATSRTQMIQWIDDVTRVMYKLYKKHTITANMLNKWTNRYKIPKVPCIVFYDIWNKSSTFSKVQIQEDGVVMLTYSIDSKDHTIGGIQEIEEHANKTVQRLGELLGTPVAGMEMADISYDCSMSVSMIGINANTLMNRIHTALGNAVPLLFPVPKGGHETVRNEYIFKRASNLDYDFSVAEMLQSLLEYRVDMESIRKLFLEFGHTNAQFDSAVEELAFAETQGKVVRPAIDMDRSDPPIISFSQKNGSLLIGIKHLPSIEEARRGLRWFASILFSTIHSLKKEEKLVEVVSVGPSEEEEPSVEEAEAEVAEGEEAPSRRSSPFEFEEEEEGEVSPIIRSESSESFEFDGGGLRYLLDRLQKADNAIFANEKKNYAKGCQKPFQPLVMTREEWDASKAKVANSILYRGNYYSCPRIWCQETGVVMTEEEFKKKGKCPGKGEDPTILRPDPNIRFIGLKKSALIENKQKLHFPCCFKSDQLKKAYEKGETYEDLTVYNDKGKEVKFDQGKAPKKEEKRRGVVMGEETYIFKKREPVPERGRYGSIPKSLYGLFYPQLAEQATNITTQETIIRYGLGVQEDSLMESIAYVLDLEPGKKNKEGLIEKLLEVLDPLTFLSLEGGAILSAFVSHGPPGVTYDSWRNWIDQYPEYKATMGIDDPTMGPENDKIIREMKIYEAYLRFVHHLQSNDEKNTRILYNLLALYGVLLVIWERGKTSDDISLSCPYFLGYDELLEIIPSFRNRYVMLLHDSHTKYPYYEPLEIRALNQPPMIEMTLDKYPMVQDLMAKCPVPYARDDFAVVERVRGMIYWIGNLFESFDAKQFLPKTVVLGSDLHIEGLITNNMLWVQLPRISFEVLPKFVEMLASMKLEPQLAYHEDLDHRLPEASVRRDLLDLFRNKCESFGFRVYSKVPPPAPVVPVVSVMANRHTARFEGIDQELRELRDVQLKIARYFLYNYSEKVAPHIDKPRKKFIDAVLTLVLKDLWKKGDAPVSSRVRLLVKTAVEEMPLIYGTEALQQWIHTIILEPYHFYDSNLYTDHQAWVFSQLAVEAGLPSDVVVPTAAKPRKSSIPTQDDLHTVQLDEQREAPFLAEVPLMAQEGEVNIEEMPTKWKQIIKLMRLKEYAPRHIINLFTWIAHKIHSPMAWKDVQHIKYVQISNIFQKLSKDAFTKAVEPMLEEPTFRNIWITRLHQSKTITPSRLMEVMWSERTQLGNILKEVADTEPSPLWPMYLDLQIMAQLLDIFILVIFRKSYIKGEKVSDIENYRLSSKLYCNQYTTLERPLILLYQEDIKKDQNIRRFHLAFSKRRYIDPFNPRVEMEKIDYYYPSASNSPDLIQRIIYAHLEMRR